MPISNFGKIVKMRLVEIEQSQKWLIEQVKSETGLYFDRSYLHKILTGKIATPSIISSICKILDVKYPTEGGK